jgi:four helix bundle protein
MGAALGFTAQKRATSMAFQVEERAIELIEVLRPLMVRVRYRDRALADQLLRASSSVALNIGEGNYSDPGNKRARFCTAAGSANESRLALRVAIGRGYFTLAEAEPAQLLLGRILAMLWRLTH